MYLKETIIPFALTTKAKIGPCGVHALKTWCILSRSIFGALDLLFSEMDSYSYFLSDVMFGQSVNMQVGNKDQLNMGPETLS